jgi:hypothetical protein
MIENKRSDNKRRITDGRKEDIEWIRDGATGPDSLTRLDAFLGTGYGIEFISRDLSYSYRLIALP